MRLGKCLQLWSQICVIGSGDWFSLLLLSLLLFTSHSCCSDSSALATLRSLHHITLSVVPDAVFCLSLIPDITLELITMPLAPDLTSLINSPWHLINSSPQVCILCVHRIIASWRCVWELWNEYNSRKGLQFFQQTMPGNKANTIAMILADTIKLPGCLGSFRFYRLWPVLWFILD